jgi:hypothetical protein
MWSGPRNISTAMLRAWENRPDTFVCDEPLYAHYLLHTQTPHPGADYVIRHHETDWRKVVGWLTGDIPEGKSIFYQKHMTHHLLPSVEREWLDHVENVFLLREPREVLASLVQVLPQPRLEDTGIPQQRALFKWVQGRTGRTPLVLDAHNVLERPEAMLRLLCARLEVPFTPAMLSWLPGPRKTDGVWAKYWYDAVYRSTGFQPYRPKAVVVPESLNELLEQAEKDYQFLYTHRLIA